MEALHGSTERRAQLETWMDQRRRDLRIRWSEVARRAGMSAQNLLRIRKGTISISWDAADGIEDALQWERGSIEAAVLHGRRPINTSPTEPVTALNPSADPDAIPPGWTDEEEQLWKVARHVLPGLLGMPPEKPLTRWRFRWVKDEVEKIIAAERGAGVVTPSDYS